jgi:hypothetical protein
VLFRAGDRVPALNAVIEMNLIMPREIVGASATRVVCMGKIVRIVEATPPEMSPALAATIVRYRLERSDRAGEAS